MAAKKTSAGAAEAPRPFDVAALIPGTREVEIVHPQTKKPVGLRFTLRHHSAVEVRRARHENATDARQFPGFDAARHRDVKLLRALTAGWEADSGLTLNGEAIKGTEGELEALLAMPMISDAILDAVADEKAYWQGK